MLVETCEGKSRLNTSWTDRVNKRSLPPPFKKQGGWGGRFLLLFLCSGSDQQQRSRRPLQAERCNCRRSHRADWNIFKLQNNNVDIVFLNQRASVSLLKSTFIHKHGLTAATSYIYRVYNESKTGRLLKDSNKYVFWFRCGEEETEEDTWTHAHPQDLLLFI